ncbi:hypothetical protein H920_15887 [Fukomys damarensis]|uniref:Uncharacterized protein n=1 Tax=Fukomys damarensis TaxID=885580 RepID=A0A091CX09_FUKDA|nr:hypothetical protein H920_15887 [Fukomys damarensis]
MPEEEISPLSLRRRTLPPNIFPPTFLSTPEAPSSKVRNFELLLMSLISEIHYILPTDLWGLSVHLQCLRTYGFSDSTLGV